MCLFSLDKYAGVQLLGPMVVLCLILGGISPLFPRVAAPVDIPGEGILTQRVVTSQGFILGWLTAQESQHYLDLFVTVSYIMKASTCKTSEG